MRLPLSLFAAVFLLAAAEARAQAPAYILVDVGAGTVIGQRDANKLWFPASVTKLMTAYLAFEAMKTGRLKPSSPVTVSANALAEPPSKMGFKVGTVMNLDNALKMMIVKSANDIAVAIAETVGGSEARFVASMNAEARRLGMNSTVFRNPNGLPDDRQHTTARDLAVLTRAIWVEFPEYRDYFQIPAIKAGRKVLKSQNQLLERYRGANGMKTGFICASGFNMVATATRNGRTLIAVVLGADSSDARAETAAKLLNQGFSGWSLAGFGKPSLGSFGNAAARGSPVNLRDDICGKHAKRGLDDDSPLLAGLTAGSALGPKMAVMAPVVVFTGKADPPGAAAKAGTLDTGPAPVQAGAAGAPAKAKAAKGVPLPRLRPRSKGVVTGAAGAKEPRVTLNGVPVLPSTLQ